MFVENDHGSRSYFSDIQLLTKSSNILLDIDKAFLQYEFEYVPNGPFLRRNLFCNSHTDVV